MLTTIVFRYRMVMQQRPNLSDTAIQAEVKRIYGLSAESLTFLPLGADQNTAVFKFTSQPTDYFLKIRKGRFEETAVSLTQFLHEQNITEIIAPLLTQTGALWGQFSEYKTILYPYVAGHDGYEMQLTDAHWQQFGQALWKIHSASVPPEIYGRLPQETYPDKARRILEKTLSTQTDNQFNDFIAIEMAAGLQEHSKIIIDMIRKADRLAQHLKKNPLPLIVCHSDLHAGNFHLSSKNKLFIVDWDEAILAPKERDLMYVGGSLMASGRSPKEEQALFYAAYGETAVDANAIAYYRYERILQDIYAESEFIFNRDNADVDRKQDLENFKSNFYPGHTVEVAYQTDKSIAL